MERKFNEQELVRREKLKKYKELNINPFSQADKIIDNSTSLIVKYYNYSKNDLHELNFESSIVGRIMTFRGPFIILKDENGKLQVYFNKKENSELAQLVETFDIGDIIQVKGIVMKTNTGEISVKAKEIKLLTKSLKPLPEKYHGLADVEEKYRHRYVDLIINEEAKEIFWTRSKIISYVRKYFDDLKYLEADTPVLHPILGGASAKPFTTFYNALNMDFYLRIATELPLKKLLVGGFDRVYEIGRIFRNEGVDTTHNPEFTSIEFYEAYSDLDGMMKRTEDLISALAKKLNREEIVYGGNKISLKAPFKKIDMVDETSKYVGINLKNATFEEIKKIAIDNKIKIENYYTSGHLINELFELFVEETLIQPTFVYGHPIEISPLARQNEKDKRFTDRAELFINKKEYANMFSELNDPIDQLARFESQLEEKKSGNDEASEIDMDFIEALEYGMPPAGGCGIGIDRLVMLLTGKESIREVLLFPHLKNKEK
ncbi:lysine--tRNA ligase [Mesomycoplasma lagogenitalium]|uniref:Lysine--tRNA ligase n=1 Tax=Mesomycoplasma lagogenitalium TaxID=171286 RepID=A0ABY8LTQ7_9BACT|nr:lysine--tRNA ligase [Mesomycoplasma lagogenitalium]WGI36624.1 lysine--tRNA ligase [Mesomycoplasma lagogenitalium]